jgi:hypothetical protein
VPEITGGQNTLLGGRACPEVAFLREIASRFGKGSCLVCFAIFGCFSGFGGKRFSRENVLEMMELEGFL